MFLLRSLAVNMDLIRPIISWGHNEIAENIRTSNARDFGLGDSVEYLPELQRIAEETDLIVREKKIDLLKWKWLDDNTFFKTFDIESVFAYLLKLEMIERWVTLDKARGEKTFRELVGAMKMGSENALEEFKKKQYKINYGYERNCKGIVSNLVTVEVDGPVSQNEICYISVGGVKLMSEVIKVIGKNAFCTSI